MSMRDPSAFWEHVAVAEPDDCWEWTAGKNGDGYGYFHGRRANIVAYELTKGAPEHFVLHTCGNRACCNPAHLYDGTHQQNMQDMQRDGTHDGKNRRGAKHPMTRLSEANVIAIRESTEMGIVLAERYGVCKATISQIRHGTRWKYFQETNL